MRLPNFALVALNLHTLIDSKRSTGTFSTVYNVMTLYRYYRKQSTIGSSKKRRRTFYSLAAAITVHQFMNPSW